MPKPTIVLIPGAWHSPVHHEGFLEQLRYAGYPTSCKRLPSVGSSDPKNHDVTTDTAFIRESLLLPELEEGKDVVLIMHSYGGCPGGAAAKGLSKAERAAAGLKGGIVGLIFMCAFVASEGDTLVSKNPGQKLHYWVTVLGETGQLGVDNPEKIFYNSVEQATASKAIGDMKSQAHPTFVTPSSPPAWPDNAFDGRRAYIKCHLDNAIPIVAQNAMVGMSGVAWQELNLTNAGHSPFLTHVKEMSDFVDELAQEWMA